MKKLHALIACCFILNLSLAQDYNFIYAKKIGGKGTDYAGTNGMSKDAFGNFYYVGSFTDTCDFDPNAGVYNLKEILIFLFLSSTVVVILFGQNLLAVLIWILFNQYLYPLLEIFISEGTLLVRLIWIRGREWRIFPHQGLLVLY
jgi:hypothetical protein